MPGALQTPGPMQAAKTQNRASRLSERQCWCAKTRNPAAHGMAGSRSLIKAAALAPVHAVHIEGHLARAFLVELGFDNNRPGLLQTRQERLRATDEQNTRLPVAGIAAAIMMDRSVIELGCNRTAIKAVANKLALDLEDDLGAFVRALSQNQIGLPARIRKIKIERVLACGLGKFCGPMHGIGLHAVLPLRGRFDRFGFHFSCNALAWSVDPAFKRGDLVIVLADSEPPIGQDRIEIVIVLGRELPVLGGGAGLERREIGLRLDPCRRQTCGWPANSLSRPCRC